MRPPIGYVMVLKDFLGEPEALRADIPWCLRQALADQREIQPEPVERDEPQRHADEFVADVVNHPGRPVSGPTERAKQAELVGRALLIVQNDVPEQRQPPIPSSSRRPGCAQRRNGSTPTRESAGSTTSFPI
jgi:hypothetical protein